MITIKDFIEVFDGTVDVYDNYTEELGIAYCGEKLTPEGEAQFAAALKLPIQQIRNDIVIIAVDAVGQSPKETEKKLLLAKDFFESAAGLCSATDYDKWFKEEE